MKIIQGLNLNNDPSVVQEGSMVYARNVKADGNSIVSDGSYTEIETMKPYNIVGHVVGLEGKIYFFCADEETDDNNQVTWSNSKIVEYDENTKEVVELNTAWHYSGGEIDGCVTGNISGERILTIAEYVNNQTTKSVTDVNNVSSQAKRAPIDFKSSLDTNGKDDSFYVTPGNDDLGFIDIDKAVDQDTRLVTNDDGSIDVSKSDNSQTEESETDGISNTTGKTEDDNASGGEVIKPDSSNDEDIVEKELISLKHINLTHSEVSDESLYTQTPKIPITNITLADYYARTIPNGVYVFYIRYEIRKDVYTKWYLASCPIFAGSPTQISTIQGGLKYINLHKDSTMSFVLNVNHLIQDNINLYEKFQLGFLISHDDSVNARAWKTFSMNTDVIYFDYDDVTDVTIEELTEVTYGLYNVRNIAAFRNRLFISNYRESDLNPKDTLSLAKNISIDLKVGEAASNGNKNNDFTKLAGKNLTWDNNKGYYTGFEGEGTFEQNSSSKSILWNSINTNNSRFSDIASSGSEHQSVKAATFDMDWNGVDDNEYIEVSKDKSVGKLYGIKIDKNSNSISLKRPSIIIVDNIVNKLKGYKEFGECQRINTAIPTTINIDRFACYHGSDGSHTYEVEYIVNPVKANTANRHPWYNKGLPLAYCAIHRNNFKYQNSETLSKLPDYISVVQKGKEQSFKGIGYGGHDDFLDDTVGFLGMSCGFDDNGKMTQEGTFDNIKENITKAIKDYSNVKYASCYIISGTTKWYLGNPVSTDLEDDDFVVSPDITWKNSELNYREDSKTLDKNNILKNQAFINKINNVIKSAIVGINKECDGFTLKVHDINGQSGIQNNVNKIYIELKQYNYTCDSDSDKTDNVQLSGDARTNFIHYHRVIKMQIVDYTIQATLGFADGTVSFVNEKDTVEPSIPTLMPLSTYDVYAHFIDEHGIITNGVLCASLKTADVVKDISNIYITSKYTSLNVSKYKAYFLSIINTGPIVIELFNVKKRNGYVYAESIEIDTLLFALNENITIINGNHRSSTQQKIITNSAVYYGSGCSNPLEAFGNVGFIRWKDTGDDITDSRLFAIIKRKVNTDDDILTLKKSTPYYSLSNINVVNESPKNDFYDSYLCEVIKPEYDLASTMYVSGNNVFVANRGDNNKNVLDLKEYTEAVEQDRGSKHFVHCNYNLQYLSTTKDIDDQIFTYGSGSVKSKEVAKMIDSAILSTIYTLPGMYKDFTYPSFTNRNEYAQTQFDNTVRMSNTLLDEAANNSIYTFFGTEYYNVPTDRGTITKLFHIGNNIFVHTKSALYKFDGNQTLETTDKDITLKNADVFETGLTQLLDSEFGYAGLSDKHSGVITFDSYFFYDAISKHIFSYAGQGQISIIDSDVWKLIQWFNPDKCYTIADVQNNRVFFDFERGEEVCICLSYNYSLKRFISIHDLTLKNAFNSQILCYGYENNLVSLFTNPIYDTTVDEDKNNTTTFLGGIESADLGSTDYSHIEVSFLFFAKNSQIDSLESVQILVNKIKGIVDDWSLGIEKSVPENPIEAMIIDTDICKSQIIKGNVNDKARPNSLLDYKGFKYQKGFWVSNYFRDVSNINDVYKYEKGIDQEYYDYLKRALHSDNNSLLYGRWFIISLRLTPPFRLEAIEVNTNTYN